MQRLFWLAAVLCGSLVFSYIPAFVAETAEATFVEAWSGALEEAWDAEFFVQWDEVAVAGQTSGPVTFVREPGTYVRRGEIVAYEGRPGPGHAAPLVAPLSGVVRYSERGQPQTGSAVFTVRDTASVTLSAAMSAGRVRRLSAGKDVNVRLSLGEEERTVKANVAAISAAVDGVALVTLTTHETHALLTAPSQLSGTIVVRTAGYGTIVPSEALARRQGRDGVLVQQTDGPVWVPVHVAARTLTQALVDGVAPGAAVLVGAPTQ